MNKPYAFTLLAFCLMVSSAIAGSKTHCKSGEVVFFTCSILNSNKVVSLCGERDVETNDISWLQYRFGRIGHPELIYPVSKHESVNKFHRSYLNSHESSYEQYDIWFHIGDFNYSLSAIYSNTERQAYVFYEQVDRFPKKPAIKSQGSLQCSEPPRQLMYRSLNELLRQLPPEPGEGH